MTERKTLVEEAAKAIWSADDTQPETWENKNIDEWDRDTYRVMATAALAAFEKAHTPTDDGREALARVAAKIERVPDSDAVTIDKADARILVAAGFRRSEVPEPSDIAHMIERSSLGTPEAQALRSTVSEEKAAALVAEAQRRSVPQGEPSDAQAEALKVLEEVEPLAAVFGNLMAFGRAAIALRRLVDERAALRAAWEAR